MPKYFKETVSLYPCGADKIIDPIRIRKGGVIEQGSSLVDP
jgi:hypothetical protein